MSRYNLEYYYGKESEQFTFYRLPKALITDSRFKDMSNNAKLLYGLMLDRMSLSARSGWFDDQDRVYIKYSLKSIMEDLNVKKDSAAKLISELEEIGLIDVIKQSGKASIIYVKNFISGEQLEEEKQPVEKIDQSEKQTSLEEKPVENIDYSMKSPTKNEQPVGKIDQSGNETSRKNRPLDNVDQSIYSPSSSRFERLEVVEKIAPNNTDIINNNLNNNNSNQSNQSAQDDVIGMDEVKSYMHLIRKNIDYDTLMSNADWTYREDYEELYDIICDVVCVPRKSIRIGGEVYPYELVKSKFLKLNASHLEYVLECLKNNTTKIGNIKAYLITALYNAPNTINHYYKAEVNHDLYRA